MLSDAGDQAAPFGSDLASRLTALSWFVVGCGYNPQQGTGLSGLWILMEVECGL